MITSLDQLDKTKIYSYADYLTWQFSERVEHIRLMAAPAPKHQRISFNLSRALGNFFYKKSCRVYYAPFDVKLYNQAKSLLAEKDVYSVVQPDICAICDETKIDNKGCNGSPDWIIEILSQNNQKTDIKDKYKLYEENGVLEYWIVYPNDAVVHQFVLKEGKYYSHGVFTVEEEISPYLFPELSINLSEVFE
jgi:Uma2 family endonuclease